MRTTRSAAGIGVAPTAAAPPAPPQRRSSRSHAAILAATVAILAEVGFAGLTIEGIAARAGVGKATIYRHWRSRAELVIEALGSLRLPSAPVPTDDLRADLVERARAVVATVTEPPMAAILPSLLDAAERDEELAELLRRFVAQRRRVVLDLLEAHRRSGAVAHDADLELVGDLLVGPVFYRRLVSRLPLGPAYADRLADAILDLVTPPG